MRWEILRDLVLRTTHLVCPYASRFHPNSVLTNRQNDYSLGDVDSHRDGWGNAHWNLCMKEGWWSGPY